MKALDGPPRENGIAELMQDYEISIVAHAVSKDTTTMLIQRVIDIRPDDKETIPRCLIARKVSFKHLNPNLPYDWRIEFDGTTPEDLLSFSAYSIVESRRPSDAIRLIEKTRPDFVQALRENRGYDRICVSPCTPEVGK